MEGKWGGLNEIVLYVVLLCWLGPQQQTWLIISNAERCVGNRERTRWRWYDSTQAGEAVLCGLRAYVMDAEEVEGEYCGVGRTYIKKRENERSVK
jgi:hypothetical protein